MKSTSAFERLGKFIVRRRYLIIVVWIAIMIAVIPVILRAGNITSLQQGSTTGSQLESVKADNAISAQFEGAVHNSSLLIVIQTDNVSSLNAQSFVEDLSSRIKSDSTIIGLQNVTSVYSELDSILNQTNNLAHKIYQSTNSTARLLYGVPALFVSVWKSAYNETHNAQVANGIAYNQTRGVLVEENNTSFELFSSHVLDLFNASWVESFDDPSTINFSLTQRASVASADSSLEYVNSYMAPSSREFGTSLIRAFTFRDFLDGDAIRENGTFARFSITYVANVTGLSVPIVNGSYSLGSNFSSTKLEQLSGNIIWNPGLYQTGSEISQLISSFVNQSRNTTLISLGLAVSSDSNIVSIRSIAHAELVSLGSSLGVHSIWLTGSDALNYDFSGSTGQDLGIILPVTLILLIVATGLFFRSALTPFITLGTIGVAILVAQIFIVLVGTYVAKVDFTIPTILLTILIGVGTDYSVFIIARYREERVRGLSVSDAVTKSVTWAGESIATSGATVVIAFLSLALTLIVYFRTIGLVVGLGVLVALCVALTLVPSIITIIGGRTFWPNSGRRFERYSVSVLTKLEKKSGYFSKSGEFSVRRAKALIIIAIVITIPTLYVYATTTQTYDFLAGLPSNLESVRASNYLTATFGGGKLFPSYVVAEFGRPIWNGTSFDVQEMNTMQQISSYLSSNPDIQNVTGPTMPFGSPVPFENLSRSVAADNRTINSILSNIGKDYSTALVTVNFKIDPYSSNAIKDAAQIRNYIHQTFGNSPNVIAIYYGGSSGSILDTKNLVGGQFNSILPIVAIGVALVLLIVLGSLFLPLFAVASVLMSIIWTLAITKIVFQHFFHYGLLFITPLFLFVTLLGLGMDYNIFILTRIREEASKGQKLNDAIIHAIEHTGGIITAAAIILAGSLGALMISSDLLLKEIGFAFSFSILIDALFVRTYLVPAVMSSMQKWNWYNPLPGRKIVPIQLEYNPASKP